MARILIIVPSESYRVASFVNAAAALNVDVVVACDSVTPAIELSSPDELSPRILHISLDDLEASTEQIVKMDNILSLDAIVAIDDKGVELAACATTALGLNGNKLESATRTLHKDILREVLSGTEVPQPIYRILSNNPSLHDITSAVNTVGLPCVVKATSLSGSQGIIRANLPSEVGEAVERVRNIQIAEGRPDDAILIESYVDGPEIAVEGLLKDGKLTVLAIFDKPIPLVGPFFEESMYVTPSVHHSSLLRSAIDTTRRSVEALQLTEGPIHAEIRLEGARAYLIEVASRTIGGRCSGMLQFDNGRSLEEIVIASSLGMGLPASGGVARAANKMGVPVARMGLPASGGVAREGTAGGTISSALRKSLRLMPGYSGVWMISAPKKGIIKVIEGLDEARQVESVTSIEITAFPGSEVAPVPDGNRYIGFIFARNNSRTELIDALHRAASMIYPVIEPTISIK
ncbi:MAG: ATP-grasp domain-containing protein [Actinobacteria bacterium]|nr:ATP-grasp domain-containing protein [Actinomycetota bacterium]